MQELANLTMNFDWYSNTSSYFCDSYRNYIWVYIQNFVIILTKFIIGRVSLSNPQVASFLYNQEKMNVFVEPDVHDIFARIPGFGFIQTFYTQDAWYWSLWIMSITLLFPIYLIYLKPLLH